MKRRKSKVLNRAFSKTAQLNKIFIFLNFIRFCKVFKNSVHIFNYLLQYLMNKYFMLEIKFITNIISDERFKFVGKWFDKTHKRTLERNTCCYQLRPDDYEIFSAKKDYLNKT